MVEQIVLILHHEFLSLLLPLPLQIPQLCLFRHS